MNATAIVKIVRGGSAAGRLSGRAFPESPTMARSLSRSDRRSIWFTERAGPFDDGRARDEGLVADAASTGPKRNAGDPLPGRLWTSIWVRRRDWLAQSSRPRPESQSSNHTSEDA